jgi:hypothetical protein
VRQLLEQYQGAIERKLQELLNAGVPLKDLRLMRGADQPHTTFIMVAERQVAEFVLKLDATL